MLLLWTSPSLKCNWRKQTKKYIYIYFANQSIPNLYPFFFFFGNVHTFYPTGVTLTFKKKCSWFLLPSGLCGYCKNLPTRLKTKKQQQKKKKKNLEALTQVGSSKRSTQTTTTTTTLESQKKQKCSDCWSKQSAVRVWLRPRPILCRHCDGLNKAHTHTTHAQIRSHVHNQRLLQDPPDEPENRHQPRRRTQLSSWLKCSGEETARSRETRLIPNSEATRRGCVCESSTSFPGRWYLRDICAGKSNKMDLVGLPKRKQTKKKNQRSLKFIFKKKNGQCATEELN